MTGDVDTLGQLEQLFARYRDRGDVTAMAQVYELTAVRLLSLAMHLCSNPSEAEDAVQATFLAALADANSWQADRPLLPWLFGILTNRVRRLRRDAARQPDAARLRIERTRDPVAMMDEVEFSRAVDEAIESLPRMYQPVLVLRLKHGMDPVDIAHALRRPAGTVRSQLSRGMELLRKALPTVFAGAVAAWALPTRGLAAVRQTVMHAANGARKSLFWAKASAWLRSGLLATAASLVVALAWLSTTPSAATLPRANGEAAEPQPALSEGTSNELASEPDFGMRSQPVDSRPAIPSGDLVVHLERGGQPAAAAPLRADFLGDSPVHLVRRVVLGRVVRVHRSAPWDPAEVAPSGAMRSASTDSTGIATLAGLQPGFWLLHLPSTSGVVLVRAGLAAEVHHTLGDEAIEVHGVVVDEGGHAIEGAWIWAGRQTDGGITQPLLRTGPGGRFETWLPRAVMVSARAVGRVPGSVMLNPADPRAELRLVCRSGGGSVEGVVLDSQGVPMAQALVQLGDEADLWPRHRNAGVSAVHGVPGTMRTDQEGRFRCEGLAPGRIRVTARVRGKGAAAAEVEVSAGQASTAILRLARGATLHGVVTDAEGTPAPFEQVRVLARGEHSQAWTTTDAEGRYELCGVHPGTVAVLAGLGGAGFARSRIPLREGDRTEWNAQLDPVARIIRGRVLGPDGRPGRYRVALEAPRQQVDTDADGEFAFTVADDRMDHLATVLVYPPSDDPASVANKQPGCGAIAWRTGIEPGDQHVEVRVADVARTASVRGRVVVDELLDAGRLALVHELAWNRFLLAVQVDAPSRPVAWRADRLPAGDYRLLLKDRQIARFRLAEGEHLDLGELVVRTHGIRQVASEPHAAGRRLLTFVRPDDAGLAGSLQVELRDEHGQELSWNTPFGSSTAWTIPLTLPIGRYRLLASDDGGLFADETVVVEDPADEMYARRILLQRR